MYSDFDREVGEARVEQERDARVGKVRAKLTRAGTLECVDCGCTISLARRQVYPAATRCAECQTDFEREIYCR
jgi:RNA polymerase-binding transcription factor DksA